MSVFDDIKGFINDILDSGIKRQNEVIQAFIKTTSKQYSDDIKTYFKQSFEVSEGDIASIRQDLYIIKQNQELIKQDISILKQMLQDNAKMQEETMAVSPTSYKNIDVQVEQPVLITYYAGQVDCFNPYGFVMSKLTTIKQDDSIFIINLIDGFKGEYEIIDNSEVKSGVLQVINPIISDSSEYEVLTNDVPSDIEVVSKGTVLREGNILKIINKQKIRII
ncbi:MAG: hypothetical protein IJE12_05790 [Prevotella sp.]|nr:hypothetical protein [Prevotella sp.]